MKLHVTLKRRGSMYVGKIRQGCTQGEVVLKVAHPNHKLVKTMVKAYLDYTEHSEAHVDGNASYLLTEVEEAKCPLPN